METFSISILDLIIVLIYMAVIVWWGLKNGKSQDSQSYFLAGRSMPWWVVGLSLFAASISSTTLIGQSGDAYHTGLAVFNYNLTGIIVMVFFAVFLLPLYIKSGIFTIPEFLEKRFDRRSRYYFSGICIIGNIFLDAAGALYAAALIITKSTSWAFAWCIKPISSCSAFVCLHSNFIWWLMERVIRLSLSASSVTAPYRLDSRLPSKFKFGPCNTKTCFKPTPQNS